MTMKDKKNVTNFRCRVNILDGKNAADSKEQNLGESGHELCGRDENIDAVSSFVYEVETLDGGGEPVVGE